MKMNMIETLNTKGSIKLCLDMDIKKESVSIKRNIKQRLYQLPGIVVDA